MKIAVVYPNTYRVGMSNLGYQAVYAMLRSRADLFVDRAFLPEPRQMEEIRRTGKRLTSLEEGIWLSDFDLLGFSLSFENDYPGVLAVLDAAGIPLYSDRRKPGDPLVFAGGICSFSNPEPLADFFDLFLLGEAEQMLEEFVDLCLDARADLTDRPRFLPLLQRIQGAYVPRYYLPRYDPDERLVGMDSIQGFPETVRKRTVQDLDRFPVSSFAVSPETEFENLYLVEVGRGCGNRCRFCAAGHLYLPPRNRSGEAIAGELRAAPDPKAGLGLLGTAVSEHPQIERIVRDAAGGGRRVSLSSIRADRASADLYRMLADSGLKSVALAPETGTERLRRVVNKDLSDQDLRLEVDRIADAGIEKLKLYFLVGLPTEQDRDVEAIVELVRDLKDRASGDSDGRSLRITVSVNPFVPKPHTPFQWHRFEDAKALRKKYLLIREDLKRVKGVELRFESIRLARIQALLSLGDRRVSGLLEAVNDLGGDWPRAIRQTGFDPDAVIHRPRELDEFLPWDFIETGLSRKYLIEEYRRGLEGRTSPPCDVGSCRLCGCC